MITIGEYTGLRPCARKDRHKTAAIAEAAIRSLRKRGLHRPRLGHLHPYLCRACGCYHVGHRGGAR